MPIPRRYTTEAIVLSRFDLGEADRVLTLITPGVGKLKAIAKGVRRPTSRLGGSLEPFAELTVALARGRTFDVVTQVSVGHAWLQPARLARDRRPPRGTSPSWPTGRSRSATPPSRSTRSCDGPTSCSTPGWRRAASPAGTRCTCSTSSASDPRSTAASSAIASSRRTSASAGSRRSAGSCASAVPVRPTTGPASALEALKLLKAYQRLDIEAIAELRLSPGVERETEAALREFVRHALERDARSLAFLDEVRTPH